MTKITTQREPFFCSVCNDIVIFYQEIKIEPPYNFKYVHFETCENYEHCGINLNWSKYVHPKLKQQLNNTNILLIIHELFSHEVEITF